MIALLLLQVSLLTRPLYLAEEPPELRSAQHVLVLHRDVPDVHPSVRATPAEALALAERAAAELAEGASFEAVVRKYSMARDARHGGVLGTYAPGMLAGPLDEFLFSAEVGDVSAPLTTERGIHLIQRIDTRAAILQIFVSKGAEARDRAQALAERARSGEDFADLAGEHSDDTESGAVGGQYQIFERGVRDRMLKAAAFKLALGAVSDPIESPLGWHVLKRVPVDQVDPSLTELKTVRARAILITWNGAVGASPGLVRDQLEAENLTGELYELLQEGADFAALAKLHTDDPGGRERGGDLGWLHRGTPDMPLVLDRLFTRPAKTLHEPAATSAGYVILYRER